MRNIKNALKNYFANCALGLAGAGLILTGDVSGAVALNELNK